MSVCIVANLLCVCVRKREEEEDGLDTVLYLLTYLPKDLPAHLPTYLGYETKMLVCKCATRTKHHQYR